MDSDSPRTELSDAVVDAGRPLSDVQRWGRVSLPVSERRLLLVVFDLLALNGGLVLTLFLDHYFQLGWTLIGRNSGWLIALNALWLLFGAAFDIYDLQRSSTLRTVLPGVLKAGALTLFVYLLIPQLSPPLPRSRFLLLVFTSMILILLVVGRFVYARLLSGGRFERRVLIIGAGWAGRTIAQVVQDRGDGSYRTVGFVDDDPAKLGKMVPIPGSLRRPGAGKPASPRVLGDRSALTGLIHRHRVNTLVLGITRTLDAELTEILLDCLEQGVEILPMALLYEQLTGRVPIQHVGDNWYMAMPIHHSGTENLYPLAKRVLDLVLAAFGLLILAIVWPVVALAIRLDSPGPVFYTQSRVGRGGRLFSIIKFRTMRVDAEQGGPVWAQVNDHRTTRVGRVLRRVHLDELPQAINVLRGEMSAVGPRPERPELVDHLAKEISFYRVRHAVKPGMAGWGLVYQGYASSTDDALVKLQYDLYYIKHQSIWLDLSILLKTIVSSLSFAGR